MLSDFQQDLVWKGWLEAEIRAAYFASLIQRFQQLQRALTVAGLVLSSGATVALLTSVIPPDRNWIKPVLTLLAAAISLWSLIAKYERNSIECADLHSRWNALALRYEMLWADMFEDKASMELQALRTEEIAISKSSTSQPTYSGLLLKAQRNIEMHHQERAAA